MPEPDTVTSIIAYWGDDRDVSFILFRDEPYDGKYGGISSAFTRFICEGHTTEVLEVTHYTTEEHWSSVANRCAYWRDQLSAQGYVFK
jgi:hypothetical protein